MHVLNTKQGIYPKEGETMAKDGTNRGGLRFGNNGRPKKPLVEKIEDGDLNASVVQLPETVEIDGKDMPPVKSYMQKQQRDGTDLCAEEVYKDTWTWLKQRGVTRLINIQLVEEYAMAVARWIQTENAISEFGLLAKHPTTGQAIASPYVSMSQQYMKTVNQLWYQIYQIVRDNCETAYTGNTPQDDAMERLLRARKG